MKKIASLFLALTLCMGLAVPAFAAEVKSDKYTYTLSNEPVGTTEHKDYEGTHTVYLVPDGTTITVMDDTKKLSGVCISEDTPIDYDAGSSYTLTSGNWNFSEGGAKIYWIGSYSKDKESTSLPDDEGIWLAINPNAAAKPAAPAKTEQSTKPAAPAKSGTYTVKAGDTYGTIALNNYGTLDVWKELCNVNNGAKLVVGAQLLLPEKLNKTVKIAAPVAAQGESLYTVKAGDTLGAIAIAHYGNIMQYKAIYERNADRLVNANIIYEGQIIVLPAK